MKAPKVQRLSCECGGSHHSQPGLSSYCNLQWRCNLEASQILAYRSRSRSSLLRCSSTSTAPPTEDGPDLHSIASLFKMLFVRHCCLSAECYVSALLECWPAVHVIIGRTTNICQCTLIPLLMVYFNTYSPLCSSRFLKVRVWLQPKNNPWIRTPGLYLRCRLYQIVPSLNITH